VTIVKRMFDMGFTVRLLKSMKKPSSLMSHRRLANYDQEENPSFSIKQYKKKINLGDCNSSESALLL